MSFHKTEFLCKLNFFLRIKFKIKHCVLCLGWSKTSCTCTMQSGQQSALISCHSITALWKHCVCLHAKQHSSMNSKSTREAVWLQLYNTLFVMTNKLQLGIHNLIMFCFWIWRQVGCVPYSFLRKCSVFMPVMECHFWCWAGPDHRYEGEGRESFEEMGVENSSYI